MLEARGRLDKGEDSNEKKNEMEYVPPIISNITLEYILPNMPKEDQVEFDTSELSFPKFFVLKRRYKEKK